MENNFQSRLRHVLSDKKMTASELSRLSGVGKSDISNYLNGKYLPKQEKIYLLAHALNVNPGWLMTGVEQTEEEKKPIVIPDTNMFKLIMENMSYEDLVIVTDAFKRTEEKMKEKGII